MIDGSSASENRWIIDGAESTNLQYGTSGKQLVTDFVDEVQVKSSGYTAEYGGSTGGVINVVTKTGTNQWRGDALLYWSASSLDGGSTPTLRLNPTNPTTQSEYITYPKDDYNRLELGFNIGGPLVRDKVRFFAGYVPVFRPYERTAEFSDGVTGTNSRDYRANNATANITAQLGPRWRFKTALNMSNQKYEGRLQNQDGSSSSTASWNINDVYPNWSLSGTLDWTPSNTVYMSLRGGYYFDNYHTEGIYDGDRVWYQASSMGLPGVPSEYQHPYNWSNVPDNFDYTREKQKRLQFQWDTTLFFSAGGQHQLKGGVQFDRIGVDQLIGESGQRLLFYWNQASGGVRGDYGYYRVRSNGVFPNQGYIVQGDLSVNNLGLFIQDSWTISNRFTLNLGLRTENEHVPSFSEYPSIPSTAIQFNFGDKLAPRVGFAWDLMGDGKTKVYGSWGMFYDIMKLKLPIGSFGGAKWLEYWYTLDSGDISPIVDNDSCPPACPGTLFRGPIDYRHPSNDPADNLIDPDIKQMRMQEATIGVEHEIASNLSVAARYVKKHLDRTIEDVGALDAWQNEIYTMANPGFGQAASFYPAGGTSPIAYPKAKRDYDAVELSLNKRMSNNWSGRFSYMWSRLYGNYSGLSQSDENGRTSPNVGRNFDYPLMSFDENGQPVLGVLATDRTHQLKAQFIYDFSFGATLGVNWYGASGIPRTREAAFIQGNAFPVQYLGRNSDGRMPFYNRFDLYAQQEFRLGDRTRLTFSANVLNLFNSKTAINYYQTQLYSGQAIDVTETEFYNGINTQALIAEQGLIQDPRFLKDNSYQDPITVRLGVKLSF
jgi:hypothetical protein